MLDKLRALFDGKTTTRLVLAGVAIAWGIQTITDTVRELEARADELQALIAEREAELDELDDDLDEDTITIPIPIPIINTHPAGTGRQVPPSPFINHDTHDIDLTANDESVRMFHESRDSEPQVAP
jgi:hypothetical protein